MTPSSEVIQFLRQFNHPDITASCTVMKHGDFYKEYTHNIIIEIYYDDEESRFVGTVNESLITHYHLFIVDVFSDALELAHSLLDDSECLEGIVVLINKYKWDEV